MNEFILLGFAMSAAVLLLLNWWWESFQHARRLQAIPVRIHVNGIRGKSSVTRLVAGMLRSRERVTLAKTTGSAACVIDTQGVDQPIRRAGAPTILEQIQFVKRAPASLDAVVIECMAIKPQYQHVCESKIVRSNIGILTNVREDHQDQMGESLEEITASLMNTCPVNGTLVTAETNPGLIKIMHELAARKNTSLVLADTEQVSDEDISKFSYLAFKENVAIGLAIANLLGIDRKLALDGMATAQPDPGVLRLSKRSLQAKNVTWANLFAINDRQSVIHAMDRVRRMQPDDTAVVGILNNRLDREDRAIRFADIAAGDLKLDYIVCMGAYESQVVTRLLESGMDSQRIICLGEQRGYSLSQMLERTLQPVSSQNVLLAGLVNIHSNQAELLLDFFESGGPTE